MSYEFFAATLPEQGRYCIATLKPDGYWAHDWCDTKREAYDLAMDLSRRLTIYYAQGGFGPEDNRKQSNCVAMRSYHLDIDCGDTKPYPDQASGMAALHEFVAKVGLPNPSVVNSGNGLYAYWILTADVHPNLWKTYGQLLKNLCAHYKFQVDSNIGADSSRVLRPVGAIHRKDVNNPKEVRLIGNMQPPLPHEDWMSLIGAAAAHAKIELTKIGKPKLVGDINAEFRVDTPVTELPSAYRIANKCQQVAIMRDKRGVISEPLWYTTIRLLNRTCEAPEIIHKWSEGHEDYDKDITDRKIAQQSEYLAATCAAFDEANPGGCNGCPYHSHINSPWKLGFPDPTPVTAETDDSGVEDVFDALPFGFTRTTQHGIIHTDEDGVVTTVYKYDMVPVSLCHDKRVGQDILRLKHKLPEKGWQEVVVRCAHTEDRKAMAMGLMDAGIYPPTSKDERGRFNYMLRNYMDVLVEKGRRVELPPQMGWIDHDGEKAFVLGDRLVTRKGVDTIGVAPSIADMVDRSFSKSGNVKDWAAVTSILDEPGLEPWAFALASLGFGAPLMKFTGYTGGLVSMVGASGRGKTAMGSFALSVWGNPEKLKIYQRDTQNATAMRMSVYNNLPLFIDEITNIKPEDLSNLAYQITQGRDKLTLTKDRKEREGLEWATIGGASSNRSLVDALSVLKVNADAEINRIFEYEFPNNIEFNGERVYRTFQHHYGVAGEVYVKYLVDHQSEHADKLRKIQAALAQAAGSKASARYWTVIASCALYGAAIAKSLGLFHVDIARLKEWIISQITGMKEQQDTQFVTAAEWLGRLLNNNADKTITIDREEKQLTFLADVNQLRGQLRIRAELNTGRTYIDQSFVLEELAKSHLLKSGIIRELTDAGILVATNKLATLGKGVETLPRVQVRTWVINNQSESIARKPVLSVVKPKEVSVNE